MASNSSSPSNNTSQSRSDLHQQSHYGQSNFFNLIKKLSYFKPLSESEHPRSSVISFNNSAGLSSSCDSKTKVPSDNLILDGFLKNNGGYLDDSDSSDTEDTEGHQQNEINHHKHTIRVLAKKYQHEPDSTNSTSNRVISFNLPKKFFNFNLNHPEHHHQNVSTITNKQLDNEKNTKSNRAGHHHFPRATSLETNHQNYHPNRPSQSLSYQQSQPDNYQPIHVVQSRNLHLKFSQLNSSSNQPSKSHRPSDVNDQRTKDEDWNLNLKYIQSSTFPTKNSIIDPDLHQGHHYHHRHHQPHMTTAKNDLQVKKSKSPFRNLVLGQDDLLRSS